MPHKKTTLLYCSFIYIQNYISDGSILKEFSPEVRIFLIYFRLNHRGLLRFHRNFCSLWKRFVVFL